MKTSHLILIILLYALIFGSIYYVFSHYSKAADDESSLSDVWHTVKGFFSNLWDAITSANPQGSIDDAENSLSNLSIDKHILPASCIFRSGFLCKDFSYDIPNDTMNFTFQNRIGKKIIFTKASLQDGASCSQDYNITLRKLDQFDVSLSGCNISDTKAMMRLYYYDYYSSAAFTHYVEGILIIK